VRSKIENAERDPGGGNEPREGSERHARCPVRKRPVSECPEFALAEVDFVRAALLLEDQLLLSCKHEKNLFDAKAGMEHDSLKRKNGETPLIWY
jgi:hypothetical protein